MQYQIKVNIVFKDFHDAKDGCLIFSYLLENFVWNFLPVLAVQGCWLSFW